MEYHATISLEKTEQDDRLESYVRRNRILFPLSVKSRRSRICGHTLSQMFKKRCEEAYKALERDIEKDLYGSNK